MLSSPDEVELLHTDVPENKNYCENDAAAMHVYILQGEIHFLVHVLYVITLHCWPIATW